MAEGTLEFDVEALFQVTEVQVVQSCDLKGVQEAIKWIITKLNSPGHAPAAGRLGKVEEELADVIHENNALKEKVKQLEEQQVRPRGVIN